MKKHKKNEKEPKLGENKFETCAGHGCKLPRCISQSRLSAGWHKASTRANSITMRGKAESKIGMHVGWSPNSLFTL